MWPRGRCRRAWPPPCCVGSRLTNALASALRLQRCSSRRRGLVTCREALKLANGGACLVSRLRRRTGSRGPLLPRCSPTNELSSRYLPGESNAHPSFASSPDSLQVPLDCVLGPARSLDRRRDGRADETGDGRGAQGPLEKGCFTAEAV